MSNLNPKLSDKYPTRCGVAERPMETFSDVDRAVTAYLRRNDPKYRRNSELSKARNLINKQS